MICECGEFGRLTIVAFGWGSAGHGALWMGGQDQVKGWVTFFSAPYGDSRQRGLSYTKSTLMVSGLRGESGYKQFDDPQKG